MKQSLSRKLNEIAKQVTAGWCVFALLPHGYGAPAAEDCCGGPTPPAKLVQLTPPPSVTQAVSPVNVRRSELPVKVNRTLPKVEPVGPAPDFSAKPKLEELFRARIFEERSCRSESN